MGQFFKMRTALVNDGVQILKNFAVILRDLPIVDSLYSADIFCCYSIVTGTDHKPMNGYLLFAELARNTDRV